MMKQLYDTISRKTSKTITKTYSTSFSLGVSMLEEALQQPIYNIYGFVRVADEIVDSFHDFNKAILFSKFRDDTKEALKSRISTNPVLNAFQETVHAYGIEQRHIDLFLESMEMDLRKKEYNSKAEYEKYILGSAEAVGCMCLKVFVEGDEAKYKTLEKSAMKLGAAFQKVNFLRDLKEDYQVLGRTYFPGIDFNQFEDEQKQKLIDEIEKDFSEGFKGILQLPASTRLGVYLAYIYYKRLLAKIEKSSFEVLMNKRIRVSNLYKLLLLSSSYFRHKLNFM